ncbi:MAG: hypothetical protein ABJG47_02530 [Ekhidna sp.]
MRKSLFGLILFSTSMSFAQADEVVLADTVKFIVNEVKSLESLNYGQNIYRPNFEDCNLEYERSFSDDTQWLVYDFWLSDLDESKMRLDSVEGEWQLKLVSSRKKIEFDATRGSGWVSEMHFYSKEKEPILAIGKALYFAIKSCKGLDRFK